MTKIGIENMSYRGTIIEESLEDTAVLKDVKILTTVVEPVTSEHHTPWLAQWTLHTVEISKEKASEVANRLSRSLEDAHAWYADFRNPNHHYIIFRGKIFYIDRTSQKQYDAAKQYGLGLGIPEHQVDFHPGVARWER